MPASGKRGNAKGAAVMPGCWLDLDIAGPGHKQENLPSEDDAMGFLESLLKPTMIVHSGGGFHVYWLFEKPWTFKSEEDNSLAQAISAGFQRYVLNKGQEHGWKIDNASDLCRLLRLPGTFNHKGGGKVPVKVIHEDLSCRYNPIDFMRFVELASEKKVPPPPPKRVCAINNEAEKLGEGTADTDLIAAGCPWMRHCRDDAVRLTEPEWFGMLSILSRCKDGEWIAHEWSQPYSGYSYEETQEKLIHSLDGGPRTCECIYNDLGGATYCQSCPEYGKIKSPIVLGLQGNATCASDIDCTDMGNAVRMARMHGNDIRFCYSFNKWLVWNGKTWEIDAKGEVVGKAKQTVRKIKKDAKGCDQKLYQHAMASQSATKIKYMISLAKTEPGIPVSSDDLDRDEWLISCQNGTLNLKTGELMPHDRKHLITRMAPVNYDPDAECPRFMAFMDEIMAGDKEVIRFLQRAAGYSLTGDISEQCFFILCGSGANGKSTFLEVIRKMLGEYAGQTDINTFVIKRHQGIPNDLAALKGKRFVTTTEVDESKKLSEAVIKQATGGEPLSSRFLYGEYFQYEPTFKIFLGTNYMPEITGTDDGIWRRIHKIPFSVTIPEEKMDRHIKDRLFEELDGIFAWAVRGCLECVKNGLNPPTQVRFSTEDYRKEQDNIQNFIDDCCATGDAFEISKKDLYQEYAVWAKNSGEMPLKIRSFSERLKNKGFDDFKKSAMYWKGIALRVKDDLDYPLENDQDSRAVTEIVAL
jgi:putative DNA primase/helicase